MYEYPPPDEGAAMTIVNVCDPINPAESVDLIVNVNEPAALGVPDMTPVDPLSDVPVGKAPTVTA